MWIFWYFSSCHFLVLLFSHHLLSLHRVSFLSFFNAFSNMHVNYTLQKKISKVWMGVVYISYICRSIATVVHCGVMIWAMSLRMEGRGHLLHLPPLCCSPNVWMRSSLQLVTLRQMDNISNKPPPGQPSGSGTASFTLNVLKQHKRTCLHTVNFIQIIFTI